MATKVKSKSKKLRTLDREEDELSVSDILKQDDNFRQYRRIVRVVSENVDMDKLETEMASLHRGRSSRTLYGKVPTADKLIDAALRDGANRSRMAEIRMELTKQLSLVERATDTIKKYILHEFREQTAGLKTKGERMAYADQYVSRGVVLVSKLEDMITRADFMIKDVDQMGYSLKVTMSAMEIFYSHKNDKSNV